jgi:hypothetical protein
MPPPSSHGDGPAGRLARAGKLRYAPICVPIRLPRGTGTATLALGAGVQARFGTRRVRSLTWPGGSSRLVANHVRSRTAAGGHRAHGSRRTGDLHWMLAAAFLLPGAVLAQQPATMPRSGDQVRITAPSQNLVRQRGLVVAGRDDTLVVRLPDGGARAESGRILSVPVALITDLDVSLGRKSHLLHGLLMGLAVGGIVGASAGGQADCSGYDQGMCIAGGGVTGACAGGLLGSAVGAVIRTERWTEIRLEGEPRGMRDGFAWRVGVRLALPL